VANWAWARPLSWRTAKVAGAYVALLAVIQLGGAARLAWFPVDTTQTVPVAGVNPSMTLVRTLRRRVLGGYRLGEHQFELG